MAGMCAGSPLVYTRVPQKLLLWHVSDDQQQHQNKYTHSYRGDTLNIYHLDGKDTADCICVGPR
jgi:hypothetical protein